jgi:nitrate reductase assembly molybdenum cofactor insertion protein NarJ
METNIRENKLLHEAAEWRLIGLLFECPVNDWCKQVKTLAKDVTDETLKQAAEAAQEEASEGIYHSIFGPGGPAPAREVSYRSWSQPGYLLSELFSYYDAFSYNPVTYEVPDHVSVEAGFIAYLRLKEAYAMDCLDYEHATVTADAARNFIDEHLSTMVEPLAKSLASSGINYLALNSKALLHRVGAKKNEPHGKALPVLSDFESDDFECSTV